MKWQADTTSGPIRVVSISSLYPNTYDPSAGLFVQAQLRALSSLTVLKLFAPISLLNYRNWAASGASCRREWDGETEVFHPRWLYPPGGTCLNAALLAARLLTALQDISRKFRYQLIDAHFGYPEGVTAALISALVHRPFMVTLGGSELLHGQYRMRRAAMRWSLRRASRVIAVSEELQQFAISLGVQASRTVVIPNGVDTAGYYPRDRASIRDKYRIPHNDKVILSAGHLVEVKGHDRTIRALKQLLDKGRRARLLIAGGVGQGVRDTSENLKELASALRIADSVEFLGHLAPDKLAELMSAADIFCLASRREGCPNVVSEALACGLPVVATRVGSVPTLIPSEDFGIVIPLANADSELAPALAKALERSWDRAAISKFGHRRSWDTMAKDVLQQMEIAVYG